MNPPKKKDGDSYLHAIFVSIVGSSNQNQYASILYDICEYYRLVRNHIVHITNEETLIQNKYNLVQQTGELAAFNHMAVLLRWLIENDLVNDNFTAKYPDEINTVKTAPDSIEHPRAAPLL